MKIVNPNLAQSIKEQGMLKKPNTYGYICIAAEIERPSFLSSNSPTKQSLLLELKSLCKEMNFSNSSITRVDVFDAFIIPPGSKEGRNLINKKNYEVHIAAYDIVILIECKSIDDALAVKNTKELKSIQDTIITKSTEMDAMVYKNIKQINDVSKETNGIFLFNFFYSKDPQTLLDVWEFTAGWWTKKANLTNSTLLQPIEEGAQYTLINHCKWDKLIDVLPSLIFKPSFRSFVLKKFTANHIVAMPILYKLV